MSGLLSVSDVSVAFGEARVLDSVSLSVRRGEFVGLVGPNGAGKTTLLRAINGVREPDAGTVSVDGDRQADCSAKAWSRRVATVPQDTSVSFAFRVEDVVEMGRAPHRRRTQFGTSERDRRRVEDALELTNTVDLRDRRIDELSGGERQRVFVARALAQDTPLLALDEPTASLDVNHQVEILRLVRDLVGDGRAGLAAIHDLELAARFCDRLALLSDGVIRAVGPPETVLRSGALDPAFETTTAIATNPVTGTPTVTAGADIDEGRATVVSDARRVHVVGGGRIGSHAIASLRRVGHEPSAGVLRTGDVAFETAESLGVPIVTTPAAGPVDPDAVATAHELAGDASVVVLADVEIGPRQWTLDLAEGAPAVVLLEERSLSERLHSGDRARERYERLRERATIVDPGDVLSAVEAAAGPVEQPADD
ncbi:ATP-binding cassette domain-containing protein [Halapricum hydrolyticum]|uniref:Cobalamin import ATP-binding protein BtuD n=1 Tax=Halapricum hydrolyticum TaxID=2979991 RepID=A0AAE3ID39_9EURY|nr:ATP-binding cassette domain-containing protein [Halapricum hydrolyticum]MCU4718487.1 ATP-binding cassette domain-containing protein [Halapricum hydrolyticum]MCU4727494.1 ATP-binding cassette domain-containing protein [Halapricum hydrolyticum]